MSVPAPLDTAEEAARLTRLRELLVLDSAPEPLFDSIVRMAAEICGAPIALLSLVDAQRQWFKANVGLPGVGETPRDVAFCAHAIGSDAVLEVPDATLDGRFADNPFVTGSPDIRFYAGAPLVLPRGERVGTLCVIDRHANGLSDAQREQLQALAALATQALVMRQELIEKSLSVRSDYEVALEKSEAKYRALVEEQAELVSLAEPDGRLVYTNQAYARHFGFAPGQMVGKNLFDFVALPHQPMVRARIEAVFNDNRGRVGENRMRSADNADRWLEWTNTLQTDERGGRMLHSVGRDITERKQLEQRLADSERFTRHVSDNVPVRIAYVDSRRRYRFANRLHCESLGLAYGEVIGHTRRELLRAADEALTAHRIDAALAGERQHFEFEDTVAGAQHLIEAQLLPDVADNGDVRGYFSIGVDVTERVIAERALRELAAIFVNTTDYVVQSDRDGHITYLNPSARQAIGLAPDAPVAQLMFSDFNTPETDQLFQREVLPAIRAGRVWLGDATLDLRHRRAVPVSQMVIAHRDAQDRIVRFSSVMRDISEAVAAKAEAARQTAILRSVAEAIASGVAVFGADGRYQFVNRSFEQWCGLRREQILGRGAAAVLGEQEYQRRRPWMERARNGETVDFELDYPGRRPAHLAISYTPLQPDSGAVHGFVAVVQDVTQQKLEQRRLIELSRRDALTGLLNRSGFEDALQRHQRQGAEAASLAVLYIDLDRFKPVNDRHGHPIGDRVLQLFAKRLEFAVRPGDAVARLGGDEFAVALFDMRERDHALGVASKILGVAKTPFRIGALLLELDASIGVALAAGPSIDLTDLVERADAQLLKAKAAGKGRYS